MECEYCGQEEADINIDDKWYHKECYMRLKSEGERIKYEEYLPYINCISILLIFILLLYLISKL
ncbi:MAG: hypothetical protein ACFFA0_15370 [Promethearchaeota archaeon]